MPRTDVTFSSGDGTCAGWLYEPSGVGGQPAPIIVLAHGLGGLKEMRLDAFADRFCAAGYRCLVFDYRHFGASSGEPRQLLDPKRQLEDWRSAIAYARNLDGADPDRVAIWGTSFGGGHVMHIAARDRRVAAVIAQCPFTDGLASSLAIPPLTSAKLGLRALLDLASARLGRQPVMVPTFGPPGSTALMTAPDVASGMEALVPAGMKVRSEVAARFALASMRYFPGRDARKITCPAHFAVSRDDSVAPARATLRHVAKAPKGETKVLPMGHFDIYVGEGFELNIAQQLAFLTRHLPVNN